ncbi:hypothetical protein ANN_11306 [Periplaneta americana]|uniref:Tc1-like transposase DDE domain-containing protein n=1 Tax=Periplaneta americana TaxID=6978 RepID=A0ABQ8T623_PERAM|nr:hypothetical protein ANN_11306 [Periplaneta americana]
MQAASHSLDVSSVKDFVNIHEMSDGLPVERYSFELFERLTNEHQAARLTFAENHADWNPNQRQSVLFSDESRYRLTRCDGRLRVWGRPGERFSVRVVQEMDRFGGGSIMIWTGIMYNNRMDLVIVPQRLNAVRYIEDVLEEHLVPAAIGVGPAFLFVQDNARAHSAAVIRDFLRENEIEVMECPAISPDLNSIEYLWNLLDTKVRNRHQAPQTLQELGDALKEEWENIPQEEIQNLMGTMPRRCQAWCKGHEGTLEVCFRDLGTTVRWCSRHHAPTAFHLRERPGTQFARKLNRPRDSIGFDNEKNLGPFTLQPLGAVVRRKADKYQTPSRSASGDKCAIGWRLGPSRQDEGGDMLARTPLGDKQT